MCQAFRRRRDLVVSLAKAIPGLECNEPQGAFYLFPRVTSFIGKSYNGRTITSSGELALYLLDQAHVATVDGAAFCLDGYIRLSYATSDDNIREAMRRIGEALALLK
jgi:aspartate aminotransferase